MYFALPISENICTFILTLKGLINSLLFPVNVFRKLFTQKPRLSWLLSFLLSLPTRITSRSRIFNLTFVIKFQPGLSSPVAFLLSKLHQVLEILVRICYHPLKTNFTWQRLSL